MNENKHIHANRRVWDAWAEINAASDFYDLDGFKRGATSLRPLEIAELGEVEGKTLLHLQCHFGMDTLSWARRGARVTGVDFSPRAIALAEGLAAELGLAARFIQADIYELPQKLNEQFDIVFTSYGVLAWLSDLSRWGRVIARMLKPGGVFYMVEIHPFSSMLEDESPEQVLTLRYPYFADSEPMAFTAQTSYADPEGQHTPPLTNYQWFHSLGEVVNALLDAGLQLEFLHEHSMTVFRQLPFMRQDEDGWWRLPEGLPEIPLLFSIKAGKTCL